MINTQNLEEARKLIKTESRPIIVKAQSSEFNRKMLEYGKFDILLSPEAGDKKDSLRQVDSGLNEILARIAKKNNVAIGIDIQELSSLSGKEKARRLARIKQNIRICKKNYTDLIAVNYKSKSGAFSLMVSLGASTQQAKKATQEHF